MRREEPAESGRITISPNILCNPGIRLYYNDRHTARPGTESSFQIHVSRKDYAVHQLSQFNILQVC